MPKPEETIEWLTFPGMIILDELNNPDREEFLNYIKEEKPKASFMAKDVFAMDGDDYTTSVAINRLRPVWFLLAVPFSTFRKEFFK